MRFTICERTAHPKAALKRPHLQNAGGLAAQSGKRGITDLAMPQSACSAGKQGRSATLPTFSRLAEVTVTMRNQRYTNKNQSKVFAYGHHGLRQYHRFPTIPMISQGFPSIPNLFLKIKVSRRAAK